MLSAFVGSIVNGITSGHLVAFMTGWISWFALFRVLHGGVYMLYRGLTQTWVPEAGTEESLQLNDTRGAEANQPEEPPTNGRRSKASMLRNVLWPSPHHRYQPTRSSPIPNPTSSGLRQSRQRPSLNCDVTVMGWIGWIYSGLFAPTTQIIWFVAHISRSDDGATKLVKGLSIAVSALPLCIDCKARYGAALEQRYGAAWLRYAFNITNAVSCLLQGVICATLLISGVLTFDKTAGFGVPTMLLVVYPIFSLLWLYVSLQFIPIRDGGQKRSDHWYGYLPDIGMGIFAGFFLAAPAFGLFQDNGGSGYGDLKSFLGCESVALWQKFAAVMP